MGLTRAELKLTNLFTRAEITVDALADTGAVHMCVTDAQARQLGFDPEECSAQRDGGQRVARRGQAREPNR